MRNLKSLILSVCFLTIFNFSFADETAPPECTVSSNPENNYGRCVPAPDGAGGYCVFLDVGAFIRCNGNA